MQSPQGKAKLLAAIHNRLKPGGKFLSHELLARNKEEEIRTDLAQVIRVNSTPLSEANWIDALATAKLQVQQHLTGSMILTQQSIRKRVLEMRRVFHKYRHELGYIIMCAVGE